MHTATVVPCTTTTQVAPEVGEAAEDKQPASESGSAGSRSTVASSDTTSAGTEPFPVTKGASTKEKKKRARRAALQLAPVLIAALEEEEEPSRAHVATTQHNRRRYYQRTWEPRAQLLADDFRKEIELVDKWKASEVKSFAKFWPTDEYGKSAIELVGRPDIVTKKDIDEFVEHQMTSRGEDLTKGTSWKVVLFFLRRLRDAGRDFIYRAIALDNFAVPGRRGVRVLSEIKVKNGVYIVAAYNHQSVGHAFVLTVQDKNRLIYDLEE
eukprot:jgi/Phyca11/21943/fgenesh1_pg.PHYCAscaffold_251_\